MFQYDVSWEWINCCSSLHAVFQWPFGFTPCSTPFLLCGLLPHCRFAHCAQFLNVVLVAESRACLCPCFVCILNFFLHLLLLPGLNNLPSLGTLDCGGPVVIRGGGQFARWLVFHECVISWSGRFWLLPRITMVCHSWLFSTVGYSLFPLRTDMIWVPPFLSSPPPACNLSHGLPGL